MQKVRFNRGALKKKLDEAAAAAAAADAGPSNDDLIRMLAADANDAMLSGGQQAAIDMIVTKCSMSLIRSAVKHYCGGNSNTPGLSGDARKRALAGKVLAAIVQGDINGAGRAARPDMLGYCERELELERLLSLLREPNPDMTRHH